MYLSGSAFRLDERLFFEGDVLKYRKLSTNPAAKIPATEFTPHTPLRGWWLVASQRLVQEGAARRRRRTDAALFNQKRVPHHWGVVGIKKA